MNTEFIYKQLARDFGIPCDYGSIDEIMFENGQCKKDCGKIEPHECWKMYFEVMADKVCCICGEEINGYGNNPYPVKEDGRCCDKCNATKVIPARLGVLQE